MGGGASRRREAAKTETTALSEEKIRELAGPTFDPKTFDKHKDSKGCIPEETLLKLCGSLESVAIQNWMTSEAATRIQSAVRAKAARQKAQSIRYVKAQLNEDDKGNADEKLNGVGAANAGENEDANLHEDREKPDAADVPGQTVPGSAAVEDPLADSAAPVEPVYEQEDAGKVAEKAEDPLTDSAAPVEPVYEGEDADKAAEKAEDPLADSATPVEPAYESQDPDKVAEDEQPKADTAEAVLDGCADAGLSSSPVEAESQANEGIDAPANETLPKPCAAEAAVLEGQLEGGVSSAPVEAE